MKKWIIVVILIIVVIGGGSLFYVKSRANSADASTKTVQTATVEKGTLSVKVTGSGTVESASSKDVEADKVATVEDVLVSSGDTVKKGDKLVTFEDGSDPITAPISGEITSLSVASGDQLRNGQVVAHIKNYNQLETTISVDETDINKVKEGQDANITLNALDDKTFNGKVTDVAEEGTNTNGVSTFKVTLSIGNPKNIKVGMSTEATITTKIVKNALYVPVDAVHTDGSTKYVYVKTDSGVAKTTIKTGAYNDDDIQVTSGLSEGQQVVLPNANSSSSSTGRGTQKGNMPGASGGFMGGGMPGGNGANMHGGAQ
ncbi:efflux RND transporter periplasmic adaptor subunit [Heyndrickxia coagulans]|uniref:efflux RND transporter periplasmic adaptor subunit n=1 Tax=Heyndrickxia coagulans TaxID=1398 RepID=UPI000D73B2EE|nr:efflux RND transporter periplasmic adaptor subunit [Heyndrickxia coagulans]AWP36130.1 efflux transporter periplasmic adaptor subunit [Heyndrickxia coagulans]QDI61631.1 efflux RND transporter periplasmic adaptor subunit [Heyndrickxia coagulans]